MSYLSFYLTNNIPGASQADKSQSIGGYPSLTQFNLQSSLSSNLGLYDSDLILNSNFSNVPYALNTGSEIMTVNSSSGNTYYINRGIAGTYNSIQSIGRSVYAINKDFLNSSFKSGLQYRCIAIKNTSSNILKSLKLYFKGISLNVNTVVSMAIEIPKTEIITGYASSGNTISLTDNSFINLNGSAFEGNYLVITSGNNINLGREIAAFDQSTGTFSFINSFPYPVVSGNQYRIENGPSQRIISGSTSPTTNTIYTNGFSVPNGINNGISINFSSIRLNGNDLHPNEVVYLWIKRDISNNINEYINNRVIISSSFTL